MVLAATSPAREVARQAQYSIGDLLRKWQHESATKSGAAHVAVRLERLAGALEGEQESFTSLDLPWLEQTTEKMLRLANVAPPDDAWGFAGNCESLLSLAQQRRLQPRLEVVPVANEMLKSAPLALFTPPSRVALQSIVAAETPTVAGGSGSATGTACLFDRCCPDATAVPSAGRRIAETGGAASRGE